MEEEHRIILPNDHAPSHSGHGVVYIRWNYAELAVMMPGHGVAYIWWNYAELAAMMPATVTEH
jgi:hypothetical protein